MTSSPLPLPDTCPPWCTIEHGIFAGEDDHLHTGAPLYLTETVTAILCATIDPDTGATDGPYLLVDSQEWTLDHARSVGQALVALAADGAPTSHTGPHLA